MCLRCARCDSTDDDGVEGGTAKAHSSQQLVDYGHGDLPQPVISECFRPHSLDVASNGYLININEDDTASR